ncbi:MAG: MaoC family dehydratase [Oscillospiraceae bacterium]
MKHYTLATLAVGITESFETQVTAEMMQKFCDVTGDISPIHMDEAYAQQHGYAGRVVYGMLSASLFSTLAGVYLPGETCLLHSVESKFVKPVYIGDVLTVSGKVQEIHEAFEEIVIRGTIVNQKGEKVVRGIIKAGVRPDAKEASL